MKKKIELSLTSRPEKTERRTLNLREHYLSAILQGTFCNNSHISMITCSKVMTHNVFYMFSVALTLTFRKFR